MTKKLTTETFITKAKMIHGGKYLYDKVVYVRNKDKVEIGCLEHGYFIQSAGSHLMGHGCKKCAEEVMRRKRRLSLEEVLRRAKEVHGDKYDYSRMQFINTATPIEIICLEHGSFWQPYQRHVGQKSGCPSCSGNRKGSVEKFIKLAKIIHGDKYDYSRVIYKNTLTNVEIGCSEHGFFETSIRVHLKGCGCPKCGLKLGLEKLKGRGWKKITPEEFLRRAIAVHGDAYDFSRVQFVNMRTKVEVGCKVHGFVLMNPHGIIYQGDGCPLCRGYGQTTESYLEKARAVHGDRYDYSDTVYTGMLKRIKIRCREHGIFEQEARSHIGGGGRGCNKCGGCATLTKDIFLVSARKTHGDRYDYSKVEYVHNKHKVEIICKVHGSFMQRPGRHFSGDGCPFCGKEDMAAIRRTVFENVLKKAKIKHGDTYEYVGFHGVFKNVDATKIEIICKKHGKFYQTAHAHLGGAGCPFCNSSRGEGRIRAYLENGKIRYETQKTFDGCRNPKTNRLLKFDFYVPMLNLLIEFDGQQHSSAGGYIGSHQVTQKEVDDNKHRDSVKNEYAKKNGIRLVRIPYEKLKKVDEVLDALLVF